jgi:hypothetical protein
MPPQESVNGKPLRRRRHSRLTFQEPLRDQVTASHNVQILDLSLGGARIEHTIILRPGTTCHLRLPIKSQRVTVLCQVVWSRAVGYTDGGGDTHGRGLLFQTGLEFSKMAPETQKLLTAYLEAEGTPAADHEGND